MKKTPKKDRIVEMLEAINEYTPEMVICIDKTINVNGINEAYRNYKKGDLSTFKMLKEYAIKHYKK